MVSLGVYSWNSGRIIGPLLGSLLVLSVGPAWTIGFNALELRGDGRGGLDGATAVPTARHRRPGWKRRERLVGGWQTLRATPGCYHGVALLILFNLTVVPFMGLIPIYMRAEYGGGTGLTGTVASAQGVGAIIGGVMITMLAVRYRRSLLVGRLVWLLSFALGVYALAPNRAWVIVGGALLGAASSSMFISSSAIIQRDAPPASRGRVMSIMQAAMGVSYGIGLLFIGSIGDATNLHLAFGVGSVLLLVGFGVLTARSRGWRAAIDGAELLPSDRMPSDVLSVACGD